MGKGIECTIMKIYIRISAKPLAQPFPKVKNLAQPFPKVE
jgi:hypothetical protein